jgi:hypothetical protein
MSARWDSRAAQKDPDNRVLWRFHRQRLEAEAIRDSILAVAGTLDRTMGGSLLATPNFAYITNDQSRNAAQYDTTRRSVYLPVIRNAVYPVFQVLDFGDPSYPNGKRASTTVAPQALFLMNSRLILEQARAFADRLLALPGVDDAGRVQRAHALAYSRPASPVEVAEALSYLRGREERLAASQPDTGVPPEPRRRAAWAEYCQALFAANEFVYVN